MNVRRRRRSGLIRRMCPAKRSLLFEIATIRLKSGLEAVTLKSFPVITERQRLLKPLIILQTGMVIFQASHPCVKLEHTPAV